MAPLLPGSGKSGIPCERMHRTKTRACRYTTSCASGRFRQAEEIASNWLPLSLSWLRLVKVPFLLGLGKSDMPCERRHLATASACCRADDPSARGDPLLPHAAASRAMATKAARTPARQRPG